MTLTNAGETVAKNVGPCSHWIGTYAGTNKSVAESGKMGRIISKRPLWSINRQAYSSSRGRYLTEFNDAYGKHGHNPRMELPFDATAKSNKVTDLSVGSTKVT